MEINKQTNTVLEDLRGRGGDVAPSVMADGTVRLIITKATAEEKALIAAHPKEILALVADIIDIPATAAQVKKNPKKTRSPYEWVEKFRQSFAAKGMYFEWPESCLTGRNHASGNKSLLEFLEEQAEEGPYTLHIPTPYAFTISGERLADDLETPIGDFEFKRWSYDQKGCDALAAKAAR